MKHRWFMGLVAWASSSAWAAAPETSRMDTALQHYLAMERDLATYQAAHLGHHAQALEAALAAAEKKPPAGKRRARVLEQVREARRVLREGAADFASGDLERVRKHFFALSKPLIRYVGYFRASEGRYLTFFCPMKKAAWLQADATPKNPYYGKAMDKCAERVRTRGEPASLSAPPAPAPKEAPAAPPPPPTHRH
jgi:hypothetical protein